MIQIIKRRFFLGSFFSIVIQIIERLPAIV